METVSPHRPSQGKFHFLIVVVSVLAVSLLVVSIMLLREWSRRFPKMDSGVYLGTLFGLDSSGTQKVTRFYVERESDHIVFSILSPGWLPQRITELPAPIGDALLPMTLQGATEKIVLIGKEQGEHSYAGTFEGSRKKGTWELRLLPVVGHQENSKDLKLTLLLEAELYDIESKIAEAEAQVPSQRAEIDKLTVFITEGERLKARANERFVIVKDELRKVQEALLSKQEEAKKLQESLEISQKLSGMGRLVALSRESIDREGRWIESMLRPISMGTPEDLDSAVERGQKIIAIKHEIAEEKRQIERLTEGDSDEHEGDDKVSEESSG